MPSDTAVKKISQTGYQALEQYKKLFTGPPARKLFRP